MIEPNNDSSHQQNVKPHPEAVNFLYQTTPVAIGVNFIVALLLTAVLWDRVDQSDLLFWLGFLVILLLIRIYSVYTFWRSSPDNKQIDDWKIRFWIHSTRRWKGCFCSYKWIKRHFYYRRRQSLLRYWRRKKRIECSECCSIITLAFIF